MDSVKRIYESTFIVNASLDDSQIDQIIGRVQEFISSNGGELASVNKWGRKRLAYPIRKKNNGFYVVAEFTAPVRAIGQLEHFYDLEENVIRYLTIQLDKKALKARLTPAPAAVESAPVTPVPAPTAKEPLFSDESEENRTKAEPGTTN